MTKKQAAVFWDVLHFGDAAMTFMGRDEETNRPVLYYLVVEGSTLCH
jgi:hypothetical protein